MPKPLGNILVNTAAALTIVCIVHGGFHPLSSSYPAAVPNTAFGLGSALMLFLGGGAICLRNRRFPDVSLLPWFSLLAILLLSDIPSRWPTCFHGGIDVRYILGAGFAAYFLVPHLSHLGGIALWLIGASFAYLGLIEATQGRLLFSDDHPAFLYRIVQLKEHFPGIPFYNPMWNGGVEAREFFPSGILNVFLLLAPLIYLLDITAWYNELVALLLFVIHPLCTLLAVKVLKIKAPLAPLLALFSSTLWFRYQFQYGTLGFLTSAALTPLFLALLVRIAAHGAATPWHILASFALVATLTSFWTPAAFMVAPGVLVLLVPLLKFAMSKRGIILIVGLSVLNIPWLLIFLEASQVSTFMTAPQSGEVATLSYPSTRALLDDARYVLKSAAPALVLLTIPGLLLLRRNCSLTFRVFTAAIVVLFVGGLLLAPLKPRLELGRLMMVAMYLCCIPASVAIARLPHSRLSRFVSAVGVGSVILIPAIAYVFTANQTLEKYSPSSAELPELVHAIKEFSGGGRVAFSGYTQHQLDGGHVTPLPLFTNVPLYASRYQHDRWDHIDFIPTQFRKYHDAGIENFFDLYNITAIAIHDVEWLPWFSARPDFYTKVWEGRIFTIFQRRFGPKNWFLEGSGEVVEQNKNRLLVRMNTSSAVLRFNWLPFLEVEGCEKISPTSPFEGITFIRLEGCTTSTSIEVHAKSAMARILD